MIRYGSLSWVLALGVLLAVSGGEAARTTAYSGTVVAIDPEVGVLTFDEIGPWRVTQGRMLLTRRTLTITPDTSFNTFIRVDALAASPATSWRLRSMRGMSRPVIS